MSQNALAILSGLFLLQPLINFGLIPSSSQAMTQRPANSLGYGLTGGLMILGVGSTAWVMHNLALGPLSLHFMELPLLVLTMWGWQKLLGKIFRNSPLIARQLPLYFLNLAVLGAALLLIQSSSGGLGLALLRCSGMAVGYILFTLLLAFFRERAEKATIGSMIQGWPAFLMALAIFWLAWQAIASILI